MPRALGRATEQLSKISDTPRLDAELLMAARSGDRPRPAAARRSARRGARRSSPIMSSGGGRASRSPISPAIAPSGPSTWKSGPDVLDPAARQRDADRRGGRVFRRGRPAAHPRSRHRAGNAAARRARPMARSHRPWHRRFRGGARLCAPQRRAAWGWRHRAEFRLGDWAQGIDQRFDLILCNPPYVADGCGYRPGGSRL